MVKAYQEEVGRRLREARGIRTRVGMAEELGIPNSTLQSYEDGKRRVPDEMKVKLAAYYGKSITELFYAQE